MSRFKPASLALALLVLGAALSPCHAARLFNFSYYFAGAPNVSASGVIETADSPLNGPLAITNITGARSLDGGAPADITGPVSAPGFSNLLYLNGPHLDFDGLAFFAGATLVNLYYSDGNGYSEYIPGMDGIGYGELLVSEVVPKESEVPEPGTGLLLGAGLLLTAGWTRMRSRKGA